MEFIKCLVLFLLCYRKCVVAYPTDVDETNSGLKSVPLEQMVDATNHLAFKLLYLHSITNKNNIAFSPCGLGSVLVAVFEGSDGQSALEIHEAMELPWDRDVIRIGYRDIHRRLRVCGFFYIIISNICSLIT